MPLNESEPRSGSPSSPVARDWKKPQQKVAEAREVKRKLEAKWLGWR